MCKITIVFCIITCGFTLLLKIKYGTPEILKPLGNLANNFIKLNSCSDDEDSSDADKFLNTERYLLSIQEQRNEEDGNTNSEDNYVIEYDVAFTNNNQTNKENINQKVSLILSDLQLTFTEMNHLVKSH